MIWRNVVPTTRELTEMAFIGGAGGVALWAFQASYGGVGFFVFGMTLLVLSMITVHSLDRLEAPLPVTLVVLLVIYVLIGSAVGLPHRGFAGFLPSPDSMWTALTMIVSGWKALVTTAPPVGRTGDLFVLPALIGVALGGGLILVRRLERFAVVAALPAIIVLGLGIATGVNRPVSVALHGGLFGALVVAWLAWRAHLKRPLLEGTNGHGARVASAGVVLGAAMVAGILGQGVVPLGGDTTRDIWRQTVTPPFDPRVHPSPLSGYRTYVKAPGGPEGEDPVMFTVEGLPAGVPVRLGTMDSFDGLVWQVSAGEPNNPSLQDSGSFERVGARLEPDTPGDLVNIAITIEDYSDVWIPSVGEVVEMRFVGSAGGTERDRQLATEFRYNRATDTAASRVRLTTGDRYEMLVRLPNVIENLAGAEITRDVVRLGATVPARGITSSLGTPDLLGINDDGERLDFVRDLMVDFGTYSDGDRQASQIQSAAGHSEWRLSQFVRDFPNSPLVGNAEQYATTYALLFRDLGGVPTRVVMGFLPEETSLEQAVAVRATNVEAWVEVPVAEAGWIGIFPTPPRDQTSLQSSAPRQPEPDYRTQNPPPPPLTDPEFDQPATAAGDAEAPVDEGSENEAEEDSEPLIPVPGWAPSALLVSTPLWMGLAAIGAVVFAKRRRSRHRRTRGLPHERIVAGWHEVADFAIDTGRPIPKDMTRVEAAKFVGRTTQVLAIRADEIVWSGLEPDDATVAQYWDDLSGVLRSLRIRLSPLERLRATVALHSFKADRIRRKEEVRA